MNVAINWISGGLLTWYVNKYSSGFCIEIIYLWLCEKYLMASLVHLECVEELITVVSFLLLSDEWLIVDFRH